ncbi:MAG: hypothetical protein A2487_08385 [Candidatus Raymondbacteria bacterium RifOxyC12_full_50_8]|nr:MAG: hypothetical protein A2248_06575 [Candidatus Raymondbacteria bacterium RIFOXYA2_FULL_49_16]OGK05203.1 MAG: hypothetical protein A2487_08385 [Candidatus Raymondbacteria bacterium RifOxyC12_full_50_8]OGP45388.1 MAG: hypothetical protein A2324_22345 [Candidatus Raymondbacteria bacterium RIFOXYB2_FULL_49_35]
MDPMLRTFTTQLEEGADSTSRIRSLYAIRGLCEKKKSLRGEGILFLIKALNDKEYDVVRAAIHALIRLEAGEGTVHILKPKIINSSDSNVRWAIVQFLDKLGPADMLDPLVTLLADENWNIRNAALSALCGKVDKLAQRKDAAAIKVLTRILVLPNEELHRKIITTLSTMDGLSDELINECLESRSDQVRLGIIEVIGIRGNRNFLPHLIALLDDPNKAIKHRTLETFIKLHDQRTIEALITSLDEHDEKVVGLAIKALVEIGQESTTHLIKIMRQHRSRIFRSNAIRCLGELKDKRAILVLLNNLGSNYYTIRQEAINALSKINEGVKDYFEDILAVNLIAPDPFLHALASCRITRLRLRYIRVLGELKDPRVIPALKEIEMNGTDPENVVAQESLEKIFTAVWARSSTLAILAEIGDKSALALVSDTLKNERSNYVILEALRTIDRLRMRLNLTVDKTITNMLLDLAKQGNELIRAQSIKILGYGEVSGRTITALMQALKDPSYQVRATACTALGQLRKSTAAKALVEALGDPCWSVRRDAELALGNLGPASTALLIRALENENEFIVIRAARLLTTFKVQKIVSKLENILRHAPTGSEIPLFFPSFIKTLKIA